MKKTLYILLLFAWSFGGCRIKEHYGEGLHLWVNNSDHKITLSGLDHKSDVYFQTEMQSGQNFEREVGGLGDAPPPSQFYIEMVIIFDNEIKVSYGWPGMPKDLQASDVVYEKTSYNLAWDQNYNRKKLGKYDYQWTYTFTNADYEAARAISEAEDE